MYLLPCEKLIERRLETIDDRYRRAHQITEPSEWGTAKQQCFSARSGRDLRLSLDFRKKAFGGLGYVRDVCLQKANADQVACKPQPRDPFAQMRVHLRAQGQDGKQTVGRGGRYPARTKADNGEPGCRLRLLQPRVAECSDHETIQIGLAPDNRQNLSFGKGKICHIAKCSRAGGHGSHDNRAIWRSDLQGSAAQQFRYAGTGVRVEDHNPLRRA